MTEYVNISKKGQVTIPFKLRDALGLELGGKVVVTKIGQTLVMYPSVNRVDRVKKLYASVNPGNKSTDPETAINEAKKLKAYDDSPSK
ncbi:MAG: hypothetical protein ACD_22C00009G0011 [uncultured bacterium]|uniref:SpoVT-AbrB domain-containing protein n=1 Tax=candidate division WWE3 bacterium RBG_16_37_10 TaxID=1802610 RepID=A0A1F4V2R0_UNCKA|nr:MAG: hypothetical protein ACD_22C00009G0011 [uncultured bacterium]OGC51495.1 MAG: hypothetical protein A2W32_02540 [candidate division WWE3 bacterium RBG_16_37_10]